MSESGFASNLESITAFERLDAMGEGDTSAAALSPDGRYLALAPNDRYAVCVFDTHTAQMVRNIPVGGAGSREETAVALAWSGQGDLALLTDSDDLAVIRPDRDLTPRHLCRFHRNISVPVSPASHPLTSDIDWDRDLAWSPDVTKIAAATGGGELLLIAYPGGSVTRRRVFGDEDIIHVSWSPSGNHIALGTLGKVHIVDATTLVDVTTIDTLLNYAAMAWSPEGDFLAVCGPGTDVTLHRLNGGGPAKATVAGYPPKEPAEPRGVTSPQAIAISPDGGSVAVGYSDETVVLADTAGILPPKVILDQALFGTRLLLCVGDEVACLDEWGAITFVDTRTGMRRSYAVCVEAPEDILDISWHPNSRHCAIRLLQTTVVWDTAITKVHVLPDPRHIPYDSRIAWSESEGLVSLVSSDGTQWSHQLFPSQSSLLEGDRWMTGSGALPPASATGQNIQPWLTMSLKEPVPSPDGSRFLTASHGTFAVTNNAGQPLAPLLELFRWETPEYCFRNPVTGAVISESAGASANYRVLTADAFGRLDGVPPKSTRGSRRLDEASGT